MEGMLAAADQPVRKVTIVGGGTAGWMTAAVLSQWLSNVEIRLIESEEIGTIGVGEATIPHIRNLLALAGVDPLKLISESKANFHPFSTTPIIARQGALSVRLSLATVHARTHALG